MPRRFGRVTTVLLLAAAVAACADSPTGPASSPTRSIATVLAPPPSSCGAVLGPSTFTRATGAPVAERVTFAVAQPGDWYQLVVTGGDAAGVTMRLALNGQSLLTAGDPLGARLELPVALAADNVIELRLAGRPGTGIQLSIVDARPVASVRIVPDIVQGTAYVLAGATQDFGAEIRDAQGRPLATRCVTWRTTDATVATVDAAGTVHALAAGSTQLVAEAGGVEASIPIVVLKPEPGVPTSTRSTPGPCIWRPGPGYFGCFAAEVSTSALADGRTLITVKIRNRQGGGPLADAPQSLPATVIYRIDLLDLTGRASTPVSGFSVALDSAVTTVGSTPTASLTTGATLPIANPPYGFVTYRGWEIDIQRGISGCDTPSLPGEFANWRTCGTQGGSVTFSFVGGGGERFANSLFLHVFMTGIYLFEPTTYACVNIGSSLTDFPNCRPGGPLAP